MKRLMTALAVAAALTVPSGGLALADNFHPLVGQQGQPDFNHTGITCNGVLDTAPGVTPGNTFTSPLAPNLHGSPFNPIAAAPYAGNTGNPATNVHAVSQYDVACFQQTQHAG
jgi:hypothetical protein